MRLKSFYGTSASQAMSHIKEELGEDAIIISTEQDGPNSFHITAAIDHTSPSHVPMHNMAREQILEEMHALFETQKIPFEGIQKTLNEIDEHLQDTFEDTLVTLFDAKIAPSSYDHRIDYFIGNQGAGKTLSIIKLATELHLQGQNISIITTDMDKVGGVEQLDSVAQLLNISLTAVEDHHALLAAIAYNQDKDKILIDTGGLNPYNPEDLKMTKALQSSKHDVNTIFVTQANIDPFELEEMLEELTQIRIDSIYFTKLDLCRRTSSLLHILLNFDIPIGMISDTGSLDNPMKAFNTSTLLSLLLPCAKTELSLKKVS